MTSFAPVRAVQRGLAVLRVISESGPLSIREIVERCGMAQPTVVRMLETLIHEGFVYRQNGTAVYKVTGRTMTLSAGFDSKSRLLEVAMPIIDRLHVQIGWPSNLAMFDRDAMVIIYSNRAALGLSIPGRLGARLPLLATGVGLVTLASLSEGDREDALRHAAKAGDRWSNEARLLAGLPEKLGKISLDGHAFADEGYLDTIYQSLIWAVAVPIVTGDGQAVAAISSLVLRNAGARQKLLASILPKLRAAASDIGRAIDEDRASGSQ
ncbi:IclR family transcriptional regulator [Sphingomonas abietis]|uniref:Helix-turn-helix domain-containing protein n=1 Tax=Sphingomonas abietis TaxID=3012344 RepID=A0ABY7NKF4_9SPHN|nr:helix-turn-helix domain-containing protein [Sphingomonas abietis]WBO21983.1 helix-turn-helix domain-containing protein [Sphingomonas abietis]